MKININILIALIFLFNTNILSAQDKSLIDSLEKELLLCKHDTDKVIKMINLADALNSIPEKSLDYISKSLTLSKEIKYNPGIIKSYINLGIHYSVQSDFEKSIAYFDSASVLAKKTNNKRLEVASLGNAGNTYCYKGDYNKGLEYYLSALAVMKELKDSAWIATANNNIGNIYYFLGENSKALKYYEDALEIYKKVNFEKGIALATGNIANIYSENNEFEKALKYFMKSLEINKKLKDKAKIAEAHSNIGNAYSRLKQNQKAIENFLIARQLFEEMGDKNNFAIVNSAIGSHYIFTKDYSKAEKYVLDAMTISEEIGAKQNLVSAYRLKSTLDSAKGNYAMAFYYYKKFTEVKDSIFEETKSEQLTEMQTKFDSEAKEKENELLKAREVKNNALLSEKEAKNKLLNIIIYAAFAALLFVGLIAFLLLRINKQKQRANALLENKNIEIMQQKEEILVQSEYLEKANFEISKKNDDLEQFNRDVTSSINYAGRIQRAMLPDSNSIKEIFPEHFIFYRPRDIVSGDFYWIKKFENTVICVVADCTGHGVPGAFLSMLGMSLLNEIAPKKEVKTTSDLLEQLRNKIEISLRQNRALNDTRDGMDLAVFAYDTEKTSMTFSGANSSLYVSRGSEMFQYKGVSSPIGISVKPKAFESLVVDIKKGDMVYMFSDGYPDQFNHKTLRKLKTGKFREILQNLSEKLVDEQYDILSKTFDSWKGDLRQIDDVLVVGIKI